MKAYIQYKTSKNKVNMHKIDKYNYVVYRKKPINYNSQCSVPLKNSHTHTQPFYGSVDFVQDNPGELVPEETFNHSHTSCHQISLSVSSIYTVSQKKRLNFKTV